MKVQMCYVSLLFIGVRSAASIKQCSRRNLDDDREYGVAMVRLLITLSTTPRIKVAGTAIICLS